MPKQKIKHAYSFTCNIGKKMANHEITFFRYSSANQVLLESNNQTPMEIFKKPDYVLKQIAK